MGAYKVFKVGEDPERWEIFWCPDAPVHFENRVPYNRKRYTTKAAAYRRVKQLNDEKAQEEQSKTSIAC